ncbi:MAG: type IX secretion system membrane protein PorP/SprF, partial [Dolichospermum sp.]
MKKFYTNNKNKSNMKNNFYFLILCIYSTSIFAQHDPQFTQYMYNTINVNPAYAGSSGVMSVFGMYRTQWVGLDGAPNNIALSLNTPISDSNMGLGFSLVNDKIGPTSQSNISADFAYALPINDNYKLAVGIKATANLFDVDYSKLNSFSANDPLHYNVTNEFNPNIGAGAYLYSEKLYLGLSVPNILENTYYNDNEPIAKRVSKD